MKYLKTYDAYSFIDEEFQEIVDFLEQVAALIPGVSKIKLNTISPIVKYCLFFFNGDGIYKNKKYWIEVVFGKNKSAHDIRGCGIESETNYRKKYK